MKTENRTAIFKALFAVAVWGASFVATKIALRYIPPVTVAWLRFTIGVTILGAAVGLRRQWQRIQPGDLLSFALLGFLGVAFHTWLQAVGLQTARATTTSWIVASIPIFIALLGWIFLHERLHWTQVLGIALAALGVVLVISGGAPGGLFSGQCATSGDLLILLSAPNWAVFTVLSRRALQNTPAALMLFYVMAFGWAFLSGLFVVQGGWAGLPAMALDGWLGIAFLGAFCSGLAYIFWYDALKVLPAARTGAFLYLEPLFTLVVAAAVLGEEFLLATSLGGLAILLGVWLTNRTRNR
ncbi:MAG: DMT family transporter [Anaerolineales bacterium]|nr:DMT family transporter [Anaerolineales bacterium]